MGVVAAVGFIATFLGVCIAVAAYFNERHIKAGVSEIGRMIAKEEDLNRELFERMEVRAEERYRESERFHREMEIRAEERHKEIIKI